MHMHFGRLDVSMKTNVISTMHYEYMNIDALRSELANSQKNRTPGLRREFCPSPRTELRLIRSQYGNVIEGLLTQHTDVVRGRLRLRDDYRFVVTWLD